MKRNCYYNLMIELVFILGLLFSLHAFLFLVRLSSFSSPLIQSVLIVVSSVMFIGFFLKLRQVQEPLSLLELIAFKGTIDKKEVVILSLSAVFGIFLGISYWLLFANIKEFTLNLALIPIIMLTLVSVSEEIWFRGVIHGSMLHLNVNCLHENSPILTSSYHSQIREGLAIAVGTISFVTYHLITRDVVNTPVIFLGGIILGLQRSVTKSILPPIVTHVTYNLMVLPLIPL